MKLKRVLLIAPFLCTVTALACAQEWGYSGEEGPENWASIDEKFAMCGLGLNQSPIDLSNFVEADLQALDIDYQAGAVDIVNNGHTVQIDYAPGSTLTVHGHSFELKQFHFHSPSENTVDDRQFPMEGHLVHADEEGNLAVLAVLFHEGAPNPLLAKLWENMPSAGEKVTLPAGLNVTELLANGMDYYRFNGSLTTPPCSEGVWWLVMKQTGNASSEQIAQFSDTIGFANNRPRQTVNARPILR
jgi:carbonic anhydrase